MPNKDDHTQTPPEKPLVVHHETITVGVEASYLGAGVRFFVKREIEDTDELAQNNLILNNQYD